MPESATTWSTDFDPVLNQVFYINNQDGSVSFDLPCEVVITPKRHSGKGFFSKLSSKLSLIRPKSPTQRSYPCPFSDVNSKPLGGSPRSSGSSFGSLVARAVASSPAARRLSLEMDSYSLAPAPAYSSDIGTVPRNAYMMERAFDLSQHDDVFSVISDESIHSFHHELPRSEIYYDTENSVYVDELSLSPVDMERERYEVRQQILRELY
ncbi:hypothetical protein METBIDRAFT_202821 [Metschnikowia bicuspidata var. bicuspidata NRRL YB-4993]|uniref:WW domain-containing protein n=1 Tax=Metschnikowia bicuspidata var. bicuspidata NRRL YB-4993 TaxID=869754 RepID=A0A1A0H967_9ASCO|nr:hypothetical protein METBIDRAFT_202821 [Metschnikowia bicuspidata var. bicuspidata NRRL YB-4993]OBA20669.1 hypothetical protein METBIDRAFT_202821 [Metschnikowia bicuspidata var. bicuspidata NRRL YB-4993]